MFLELEVMIVKSLGSLDKYRHNIRQIYKRKHAKNLLILLRHTVETRCLLAKFVTSVEFLLLFCEFCNSVVSQFGINKVLSNLI